MVPAEKWDEPQLCWDQDSRLFSLHIAYDTLRPVSTGDKLATVDEGIIVPIAACVQGDDGGFTARRER